MSQTTLSWGCESSIGVVSAPRQRQMRCYCVVRRHYSPNLQLRNWFCQQIPHADQVVGSAGQAEDPIDLQGSAMSYLAQQSDCLQPAKALFDPLAFLLADRVARVPAWFDHPPHCLQ